RWRSGREIFGIDFIHCREVVHVLEENGGLHDVMDLGAAGFDDGFDVFHYPFVLLANISAIELVGARIEGNLTGRKKKSARFYGLRVRSDWFRCFIGEDYVFHRDSS